MFDEIAVQSQLADEWIDLPQADGWRGRTLQITADGLVVTGTQIEARYAGVLGQDYELTLARRKSLKTIQKQVQRRTIAA